MHTVFDFVSWGGGGDREEILHVFTFLYEGVSKSLRAESITK
jgi:hypothetical protein